MVSWSNQVERIDRKNDSGIMHNHTSTGTGRVEAGSCANAHPHTLRERPLAVQGVTVFQGPERGLGRRGQKGALLSSFYNPMRSPWRITREK